MQAWKVALMIIPPGLVLGMIGGDLARPVMREPADDPSQSLFAGRGQAEQAAAYPDQPEGPMDYVGGYSYAPGPAPDDSARWAPLPDYGAGTYANVPLPTVTQLDARQTALLADPDVEFAVSPPKDEAEQPAQPESAAPATPAPPEIGPEPRTPDGQLPGIW
jgi:hypothetical protein